MTLIKLVKLSIIVPLALTLFNGGVEASVCSTVFNLYKKQTQSVPKNKEEVTSMALGLIDELDKIKTLEVTLVESTNIKQALGFLKIARDSTRDFHFKMRFYKIGVNRLSWVSTCANSLIEIEEDLETELFVLTKVGSFYQVLPLEIGAIISEISLLSSENLPIPQLLNETGLSAKVDELVSEAERVIRDVDPSIEIELELFVAEFSSDANVLPITNQVLFDVQNGKLLFSQASE